MANLSINAPFDVGETVYVATHLLDEKLGRETVSVSLCCAKGTVVNFKREPNIYSGKPQTRVKIELEGGVNIKIPEEYWNDVIFTDEKECAEQCYIARFGEE